MPDKEPKAAEVRRNYRVNGSRGLFFVLATDEQDARAKYCNEFAYPVEKAADLEVALSGE